MKSNFEKYLKNSDYLRDVINTHRTASAEVIATLLVLLRKECGVTGPVIADHIKRLDESTGRPSIDVERRRIAALIGDALKRSP